MKEQLQELIEKLEELIPINSNDSGYKNAYEDGVGDAIITAKNFASLHTGEPLSTSRESGETHNPFSKAIYESKLWAEIEESFEYFNECISDDDVRDFYKRLIWEMVMSRIAESYRVRIN